MPTLRVPCPRLRGHALRSPRKHAHGKRRHGTQARSVILSVAKDLALPRTLRATTDYAYDVLGNLDQVRLPKGVVRGYDDDNLNGRTQL